MPSAAAMKLLKDAAGSITEKSEDEPEADSPEYGTADCAKRLATVMGKPDKAEEIEEILNEFFELKMSESE